MRFQVHKEAELLLGIRHKEIYLFSPNVLGLFIPDIFFFSRKVVANFVRINNTWVDKPRDLSTEQLSCIPTEL